VKYSQRLRRRKTELALAVDPLVSEIAAYVAAGDPPGDAPLATAWLALFDSLGCAMASTRVPECMALIGPIVPGTVVNPGAHIPGTSYCVDPVTAAFGTGCLIRWLDFSDTWVAQETGHPSDNIGAILATAEFESGRRRARGKCPLALDDVLRAAIQAYEIQGVLGLTNSLGEFGFDHAAFVRVASAAAAVKLLGGGFAEVCSAVSHAWCDGHPLRVYRQAPNVGSRKSWAGPDAAARGVQLALRAVRGEPPCGTVLTDPKWGMEAVHFGGKPFLLSRPLGTYVMENVLFKAAYPGVVHAQTALEAAIKLHPVVAARLDEIERIDLWTYAKAIRITSKTGKLHNPADRDHCLQYMVAVGLLKGNLDEDDFSDAAGADPRIDALRAKMSVHEDRRFTAKNLDPGIRSSANGIKVTFRDGTATKRVDIEQPLGHATRSTEGRAFLEKKLRYNLAACFPPRRLNAILALFSDRDKHGRTSVGDFVELFAL
jgi:2-methylcitrate dehydratase